MKQNHNISSHNETKQNKKTKMSNPIRTHTSFLFCFSKLRQQFHDDDDDAIISYLF